MVLFFNVLLPVYSHFAHLSSVGNFGVFSLFFEPFIRILFDSPQRLEILDSKLFLYLRVRLTLRHSSLHFTDKFYASRSAGFRSFYSCCHSSRHNFFFRVSDDLMDALARYSYPLCDFSVWQAGLSKHEDFLFSFLLFSDVSIVYFSHSLTIYLDFQYVKWLDSVIFVCYYLR